MERISSLLNPIVRVGALATECSGCYIFLPSRFPEVTFGEDLSLGASCFPNSYQTDLIISSSGMINWVSKHETPFEGILTKEDIGFELHQTDEVDVPADTEQAVLAFPVMLSRDGDAYHTRAGVLLANRTCNSPPFGELNKEILLGISRHVSTVLLLWRDSRRNADASKRSSWELFLAQVKELQNALGNDALEVARMSKSNYKKFEDELGMSEAVILTEQFERLVAQSFPPQFPLFRLPDGDLLIVFDKMMKTFLENKLQEVNQSYCINRLEGSRPDGYFFASIKTLSDTELFNYSDKGVHQNSTSKII
jgi:hypothetical protein